MHDIQLENLPRVDDKITIAESYYAVLRLIEYYNDMDSSVDEMLIDMSGDDWSGSEPNDPGAWSLWLDCVDDCKPLGESEDGRK